MPLITGEVLKKILTTVLENEEQLRGFTLGWIGLSRFAIGASDTHLTIIPISGILGRPGQRQSILLNTITDVTYEIKKTLASKLPAFGIATAMPEFPEAIFTFTTPEKKYSYKICKIAGIENEQEIFVYTENLYKFLKSRTH